MPKGYWIAHITVSDAAAYDRYRAQVAPFLADHGATFLVRAGTQITAEGDTRPRTVVIEFPNFQAAQDCYDSPAYKQIMASRSEAAQADLIIVEGYDV